MEKPMKVISLEDFRNSGEAMITVRKDDPPRPISEVRKETRALNRLVPKIEAGTFNGKDFEEVLVLFPDAVTIGMKAILEVNRRAGLKALKIDDNQTA